MIDSFKTQYQLQKNSVAVEFDWDYPPKALRFPTTSPVSLYLYISTC